MRSSRDADSTPPLTFTARAITAYGERALGYNLNGIRRAIRGVLIAERGLPPTATVDIDPVLLFGFCWQVAPALVEEWVEVLKAVVTKGDLHRPSFVICDDDHGGLRIVIRRRSVVAILPPLRRE